jgi:molybdenum cofactor biosynthesis enzyme MoaA
MKKNFTTQELVVHLTLKCPLKCSHCCVDADINKKEALTHQAVVDSIKACQQIPSIKKVSFTGGDPFVARATLLAGIKQANQLKLYTSVVTSAFWAKTGKRASAVLQPFAVAGLNEIMLSYDDAHAAFLDEQFIVNAFRAAVEFGLVVKVNVVREPGDVIDRSYMQRLLDPTCAHTESLKISETAVNSTGRAKADETTDTRQQRAQAAQVYRGPCTSVLRHISAQSNGQWVPCCGVIEPPKALHRGRLQDHRLDEVVNQAHADPVLQWLAYEGPVEIMKQITAGTEDACKDEDFDGICHACDQLFNVPENRALLAQALPEKMASLHLQNMIYSMLGLNEKQAQNQPPSEVTHD